MLKWVWAFSNAKPFLIENHVHRAPQIGTKYSSTFVTKVRPTYL